MHFLHRFAKEQNAMAIRSETRHITQDVQPEFASVDRCEVISGVSRWTWRQLAYKGKISSVKIGTRLLIPISEVRRIIAEGTRPRISCKAVETSATKRLIVHRLEGEAHTGA